MLSCADFAKVVLIGIGATMVMDGWLFVLRRFGVPTLNFAWLGRWVGHLARGRVVHAAIAKSAPIRAEVALGWGVHYATGIVFAFLLIALAGRDWVGTPSLMPALFVGAVMVMAPLFIMQPAMGAGFAASRTPTPFKNCVRSLANHTVFGLGLYAAGQGIVWLG
jgi:hypothetical protein